LQRFHTFVSGRIARTVLLISAVATYAGCASVGPAPSESSDQAQAPSTVSVPQPTSAEPADRRGPRRASADAQRAPDGSAFPDAWIGGAATRPQAGASGAGTQTDPSATAQHRDLWDRIRKGFAMPPLDTPLVAEKERFYLSKPEYLQRMMQRGGRYLFHIVEELEKRGMPTELALLPFVESAMNPVAVSPAQAAGLWQFIPSTGRQYELHQNWWVDNRRDVVKSTRAALDYLQRIYAMHGDDWFLALASYNWGEGSVGRAIKKNQARGRPTDYLSLDMPAETRHYVPKLIALKNILLQADTLGLNLPPLPNRPYFVTIDKTRPIDLKLAAQFAGMSVEEFVALNPAHNRPVISATRNNQLKLPADRVPAFLNAVERHEKAKMVFASWQPYTLKPGETLDSVAHRGGVATAELRKANGLREGQRIVAGTRILAPQGNVEDEQKVEHFVAPRVYEQIDRPPVYHTVGKAESAPSIAQRYGITTATLAAWNGIKRGVKRGMRLLVQPAATQTLLTNEDGERSIVNTQHLVKVAAAAETAQKDPEPAPAASAATPAVTASRARSLPTAATVAKSIEASGGRAARPAVRAQAGSDARQRRDSPATVARQVARKGSERVSTALGNAGLSRKAAEPQRKSTSSRTPAPVRGPIRATQDNRFGRR